MTEFKRHLVRVFKEPSGCWIWQGGKDPDGYGICRINKKSARAHRASYEHFVGPIPKGDSVLHKCDNPSCVNPEHLFLGSTADNMADKVAKQRQARGSKHGRAKLNEEAVSEILSSDKSDKQLAEKFGVSPAAIWWVRKGITWRTSKTHSN